MTEGRLAHGYSNQSWIHDGLVFKPYRGIHASKRPRTETRAVGDVSGVLPVPQVVEVDEDAVRAAFAFIEGQHGQELIDAGYARHVFHAAGTTLRHLRSGVAGLVHGDYGPQNLLFDVESLEIVAVLELGVR